MNMAIKSTKYKWESWNDLIKITDFVAVDVETTGFDSKKEKIIEIGMIKVVGGNIVEEFSSLINPGKPIPARITSLTGISDDNIKDAPIFSDIAVKIDEFIGSSLILAHNAPFDAGFISNELAVCNITKQLVYFDTLALARKAYPSLPSHKLSAMATYLQLSDSQNHRALDDARLALNLFLSIKESYSTPLAQAVFKCCSPIIDYTFNEPDEKPLDGKHICFAGDFTFSQSAAKKLAVEAGGIVDANLSNETDYLVYGYFDKFTYYPVSEKTVEKIRRGLKEGCHAISMNEVGFLKLCGVVFNLSNNE